MRRTLCIVCLSLAGASCGGSSTSVLGDAGPDSDAGSGLPDGGGRDSATPVPDGGTDSSSRDSGSAPDMGTTESGKDSGPSDSGADVIDAGPACPPVAAHSPKLVQAGSNLYALGLTSDGFLVYTDQTFSSVSVVPLAGGSPQTIASGLMYAITYVVNQTVLIWSSYQTSPMSVWTSAGGLKSLATASNYFETAFSPDLSLFTYSDHVTGGTRDLDVAASDGTNARSLVTASYCGGIAQFAGGNLFAQHCDTAADGGTPQATLSEFAGAGFIKTDLATGVLPGSWGVDAAGDAIFAALAAAPNAGEIIAVPAGTTTTVDMGVNAGFFLNASSVLYTTSAGALKGSPVSPPSPTVLVPSGVSRVISPSPDANEVVYYKTRDPLYGTTDLYVASATGPSSPSQVSPGNSFFNGFTFDSGWVLYLGNVDPNTGVGAFNAAPVAGGSSKQLAAASYYGFSICGAQVLYTANVNAMSFLSDVQFVDLSQAAAPATLLSGVSSFTPDQTGSQLVYSTNMGTAGLYVMSLR